MTLQKPVPVPPPSSLLFENGISHPDLWLWDSWTAETGGITHLYCLALSRKDIEGRPVLHEDRNDYPFHIRHFSSTDAGRTWQDHGAYLSPQTIGDGAFARNVWSGGMLARAEDDWLCGFTGLREAGKDRPFLQTICLGHSHSGFRLDTPPTTALSCPVRDYDSIRSAGYYLPTKDMLGHKDGEEGGPILAWRDPFIVAGPADTLEVFWSAKVSSVQGTVAHATVTQKGNGFQIEKLHPPILLPDADSFTQAEVPKLYYDQTSSTWFMVISACDRINESQPAEEVTKVLRLYKSTSMRGPWVSAFGREDSLVPGTEHLFGASFLPSACSSNSITLIAPYTEYASPDRQLTFAPPVSINIGEARQTSRESSEQDSH
ncbi:hypothetical protein HPO_05917 [Hyphomonas polymorpha PS728]|uniref:Uncharacterized protein n=1 Tax=Hyphomonas polymorpha PS728 TaxID=1280954 RepID=A0A062VGF2_9PROT|nr:MULTISPECIES: hypothetical protein [Hyphomonas]AXE64002.1 hypothetical protein BBF93_07045 [Hyphomonas sp. CACIAM 19H1]KCZ99449.1 hypothetical protein HPO_05917 [Hyphomonas polymorpha PS728]